jgi:hypothetical protein
VPLVYFRERTCYWTPSGFRDRDTVWEYYFEPLVATHPASRVPPHIREVIARYHPSPHEVGYSLDEHSFVSSHFGDHPALQGKTLAIPYLWDDPDDALRYAASGIIHRFIRPREYLRLDADRFVDDHFAGEYVIGVHARGTDAISNQELRAHRQGSLRLSRYATVLARLIDAQPRAKIFVATDAQDSLEYLAETFGPRVVAYNSIRHTGGAAAATGPTGWIMPAYIAADRDRAAQNGMEAVVDYLLLSRCDHLVHNGSSLARTVLLKAPRLGHTNTHRKVGLRRRFPRLQPFVSWVEARAQR